MGQLSVSSVVIPALLLAGPAFGSELALKRIMLSSAGVGYFEYEAAVEGPATLGLDVKLDQVDDVLKSLVVFDDAGGVGGIELPGRDDAREAFGDVPFGPEGLVSPLAFLNSLRGVEVSVEGPRPMTGRILRAEVVAEPPAVPNTPAAQRTRVTLLTEGGLRQFVLEDSDAVQVADPALRARIARALAASKRERAADVRHITIHSTPSTGTGARTVRVSYVAAAPLWKASYRLVLPPAGIDPATAKARLQGWATLENATGTDWSDVALSVQYGNPVTFRQAIYRSYYVTRPEVPVEVLGRLLPNVDRRARDAALDAAKATPVPMPPVPAPAPMQREAEGRTALGGMFRGQIQDVTPMTVADGAGQAAVEEGAEETVFAFATPVSLAAGHSASVPILDGDVPASRVSLAAPDGAHPLAAVRVGNDTGASLPAGVLTLYDANGRAPYAGDARLGGVPAGETRMLAFAQDLRTAAEWRHEDTQVLVAVTAARGVLRATKRNRRVSHAVLTAPAQEGRRVLVEVPKQAGSTLAPGLAKPVEETAVAWRFAVDLKPGETQTLSYALDRDEEEEIAMLEGVDELVAVSGLPGLSAPARAALERIAGLRAAEAARTAERDRLNTQREAVEADEQRLRDNLGAVQPGDALRTRLVRQLDADETRHAQLAAAIEAADAAVDKAHGALVEAVGALKL